MPQSKFLKLIIVLLTVLSCLSMASVNEEQVNIYSLTVTDSKHHLADVEVVFNGIKTKSFSVKLPVWRSGNYQILDLSKNIRNFSVYDGNDNELTWQKDDKNTWRIFINTPGEIKVKYQIYANLLKKRVSHIDETHAFLDASGVFVYSQSQRNKPLTVQLNVPEKWRSVSGMESIAEHKFKAASYDILVDSPIESGIHHFDSIQVENQLYEIVIWGDANFDMQRIKTDIEKLHYQAKLMWKSFPFTRYVYMYHAGDKLRGATEHLNSTIIHVDRFGFSPDKKYNKIIGTTAHEFIHTWNVKSYRPAGITPYNYNKENYSDLFWMAEGTTSYYDNLFPFRSEIYNAEKFLENLAKDINTYKNKPGRKVMSLSESSYDTWLKNDQNRVQNTTVSIYLKGSLVSWLLDKNIRELTDNKKSLDDLQYHLYKNYANSDSGYSSFQVKQLLKEITGHDFKQFWHDYVDGTKAINFDELLSFYGLKFSIKDDEKSRSSFNAKYIDDNGMPKVSILNNGGAAWQAGITSDDVLVALDGIRLSFDKIKERIEELKINQSYILHYFNQGVLKQTQITTQEAAPEKLIIVANDKATKKQIKVFKSWSHHNLKSLLKND